MQDKQRILSILLYAGAAYFTTIACAHAIGLKLPGLFIYYNVPSHGYQDSIIAFMSFGWAAFFFSCAAEPLRHRRQVLALLAACTVALLGLALINLFSDLGGIDTMPFWGQWLLLLGYVGALCLAYLRARGG